MPATVISSTLHDTLSWPDATIVSGDAVDIVTRLKNQSDVPIRSQASLSLNWSLMAASLIDRLQITIFPVISAKTGTSRSSAAPAISTSNYSRPAPSTATRKNSSTGPSPGDERSPSRLLGIRAYLSVIPNPPTYRPGAVPMKCRSAAREVTAPQCRPQPAARYIPTITRATGAMGAPALFDRVRTFATALDRWGHS